MAKKPCRKGIASTVVATALVASLATPFPVALPMSRNIPAIRWTELARRFPGRPMKA